MTATTEPIQFTDDILIQVYNGRIEKEQIGEKFSIKIIKGLDKLLAAKDLKKVLRLKEVNIEQELTRIHSKMIGSVGAKDELIQFLREAPYRRYKNDCEKVSDEYAHEILGGIH